MKKKILIFLAILAVACCFFAVAASAAEIPEWTEITEVSGMPDKSVFGADGTSGATSRVLMSDGKTYPAYYICKNSASLGFSYTDLSKQTGVTYAAKDVVRLEIPSGVTSTPQAVLKTENGYTSLVTASFPEGFTTLGSYTFKATTSVPSALVSVDLPSTLTKIEQYAFTYCNALEELVIPEGVTEIPVNMANYTPALKTVILPSTINKIGDSAFRSANLENGVVIPEGCTEIGSYAFKACETTSVTLPSTLTTLGIDIFRECASLTDVYSKSTIIGKQMFYTCPLMETVILENVVSIGDYAFCNPDGGTTNISTLVLPEGLTSIGTYAFTRTALTEVVLPSTLTTIGASAFIKSLKLEKIVVLGSTLGAQMFQDCGAVNELVLTENFTTLGKDALANVSQASFITYYTGTDYERIKSVCSGTTRLSQGKYYTYEDYVNENYTYNKFMVIYDVNLCVAAFDGVHSDPGDDGDCTTAVICSICKEHTFKEAKSHIVDERFTYASFTSAGEYYLGCTNDGCTNGVSEKRDALFTYLGYSAPEYGDGGINIGYRVNIDDVLEYERVNGVKISYGVFAVLEETLGENDIFDGNGTAANGVVSADFAGTDFSLFKLKMVGFEGEQKDISFAMGAYACVISNGEREYIYMQHKEPLDGEKYFFASFNEIVKIANEEE